MAMLPTKNVGPGGVKQIRDVEPHVYQGEHQQQQRQQTAHQQLVIKVQVLTYRDDEGVSGVIRRTCRPRMARIVLKVSWRVDWKICFERRRSYEFEMPYNQQMEDDVRAGVRSGRYRVADDIRMHDSMLYFDQNAPFDIYIFDPEKILDWLGQDFATEPPPQQKQLPPAQCKLPEP